MVRERADGAGADWLVRELLVLVLVRGRLAGADAWWPTCRLGGASAQAVLDVAAGRERAAPGPASMLPTNPWILVLAGPGPGPGQAGSRRRMTESATP